jgi:hypothetical protein
MKGGPGGVYAATSSDARNYRCEEKEHKESSDADACAKSEQNLCFHASAAGLVLFTARVRSVFGVPLR